MALGTVTLSTHTGGMPSAPVYLDVVSFALDDSYPTGGYEGLTALVEAKTRRDMTILAFIPQDCDGLIPVWDPANSKLKIYRGDNDGGADGPLVEVSNGADLSSFTARGLVVSH